MRIAIDVLIAEKEPGGLLFSTYALLEGLARIDQTNEYFIITGRPKEYQKFVNSPNIHIYSVKLLSWKGILIQHQLLVLDALRHIKPDLLHVSSFAAPMGWNGPLVVTVHDLAFLKVPQQASLYARLYWKYMLHESVNRAQHIITISQQSYEEIISEWSIDPARISLIHNALRPSLHYDSISTQEVASVQKRYGEHYLLHVGRIMPRKNVDKLIAAFDLIAPKFEKLHLVLTGGAGYDSDEVLQRIKTSFYQERIHMVGWISDHELGMLYTGAKALVFPSKHEGFGLPTLEAMACGTPVIASHEAASKEVAGEAVLRVDCSDENLLAEAIEQILTDEMLCVKLIEQGHTQVKSFTVEACAQVTLETYKKALDHDVSVKSVSTDLVIAEYPPVSVIIPTCRPEQAALAIESLTKQDYQGEIEIIVVGMGVDELAQQWLITPISCIPMLGPSKARNLGAANAMGDVLLFLDDDCIASAGWVLQNVKALQQPKAGAVGGVIQGLSSAFIARCTDYTNFGNFQHGPAREQLLAGASIGVTRKVFQEIGGFNESKNVGEEEDIEFFYCIQNLGYRTLYTPAIKVLHNHHRNKLGKLVSHNYKYGLSSGLLTKIEHRDVSFKNKLLYYVRFPPLFFLLLPFLALFTTTRIVMRNVFSDPMVLLYSPIILIAKISYQFGVFSHLLRNVRNNVTEVAAP